ncbi:type II toxin-antitoxin system RelB/DinJ family antitoxin [Candidatus Microgenomates bacterium]|nr:type II toxin-antitoxin system RelB/DinJ family antitoxin [Candidatus Microgenomates bacterium]
MKTVINVKTDNEVKKNAQEIARELGLSLSDIVNASLRNFIQTRAVYISAVPQMTPELERLLGSIEKDIKIGKNLSPSFSSSQEALAYLDNL